MTAQPTHSETHLPDHPGALAAALEAAVLAASADGRSMAVSSLALDYGVPSSPGATLNIEASVDRATRTLVFARAVARNGDGAVVASASAVIRILNA
jgi:acyl-coenzyme A thioesterase PaaI-like protein